MASDTVHRRIRAAAVAAVQALGLEDWNATALPVLSRKLPAVDDERPDPLPCLIVAPADEPADEPADTEGGRRRAYAFEVAFVAAGNGDWAAHLDDYMDWQAALMNLFRPPTLAGVPEVWDTEVSPGPVVRRDLVGQNYDFGSVLVRFLTHEVA